MRSLINLSNLLAYTTSSRPRLLRYRKVTLVCLVWLCLLIWYTQTIIHFSKEFIFKNNYKPISRRSYDETTSPQIPKIIHQVFFNLSDNRVEFMRKYRPFQQSWKDFNPDHRYILWNAAMIDKLVADNYPEIEPLYRKYEHKWVSRADMARYLVVHHMGGVYADMDIECKQSLNTLYKESDYKGLLLNFTYNPVGVANDFFGAFKGHNFMRHVIDGLPEADVSYITPYMGTMLRTGPVYMLGRYLNYPFTDDIYWIPPKTMLKLTDRTAHGKSWHEFDGKLIDLLWTRTGPKKICLIVFAVVFVYRLLKHYVLPERKVVGLGFRKVV